MDRKSRQPSFLSFFIRTILIGFAFWLIAFPSTNANSQKGGEGEPVVEPELANQIARDNSVGYMIYFEDKPDLTAAYAMDWEACGQFVLDTLRAHAEQSQEQVREYLDKKGVAYSSFWIDNIIVVEASNRTIFNELQTFSEIAELRARRTMELIIPEKVSVYNSVLGVESNISHVQASDVWDLGYTGAGIVVANIDTGVRYTHAALLPHYRGNLGGGSYDHNYNWWDPSGVYTTTPTDTYWHGTHTMGIMVGDDNAGNQIGMAPGAEWIACRGCPSSCPDDYLLSCAQFITAPTDIYGNNADPSKRPNIVNNSWGDCGREYNDWYQDVVDAWQAAGIYPVFSNGNSSNCSYGYPPGLNTVGNPARYGNVTGVGSTGQSDGVYATHSTWGPTDNADSINPRGYPNLKPQVLAPGVSIRSAIHTGDTNYGGGTGTSMSAPHVSGLIALIWEAAPCLIGDYSSTETIIELTATAIPYDSGGSPPPGPGNVPNYATGWGEINALAATEYAIAYCDSSLSGVVTSSFDSQPVEDVLVSAILTSTHSTYTDDTGDYFLPLTSGIYTVTASNYWYHTKVITNIFVDDVTTLNITIDPLALYTISGTVTDAATGWPVYAQLTIDDYPGDPIWNDPITGWYSITVAQGRDYSFSAQDFWGSYDTSSANSGVINGDMTLDFTLNISNSVCSAPGYYKQIFRTWDFSNGSLPLNWTVIDNIGSEAIWTFNDPAGHGNKTGGTGYFAEANSDFYDQVDMDTELRTSAMNLTNYKKLFLEFKYDWFAYLSGANEIADVDISIDGGESWTNLWRRTYATSDRGPKTAFIDLSAYDGEDWVMLRFHYYDAHYDWWWQVDDVQFVKCNRYTGGLVAGNVYDALLDQPLNGVTISNDNSIDAISVSTPDDPQVDDGFYTIYSLDGTHTFTATLTDYQPESVSIGVILSDTVEHDFELNQQFSADFAASPTFGIAPLQVSFTDTSLGNVSSWLWDFGDGITSTLQNPNHLYSNKGIFDVSLKISGSAGEDTEEKSGYIKTNNTIYLPVVLMGG